MVEAAALERLLDPTFAEAWLAPELQDIFRRRLDQIRLGHTDDSDDQRPPAAIADVAFQLALSAKDVMHPGNRENLDVAYNRCAKAAATLIATMRRIDRERRRRATSSA